MNFFKLLIERIHIVFIFFIVFIFIIVCLLFGIAINELIGTAEEEIEKKNKKNCNKT